MIVFRRAKGQLASRFVRLADQTAHLSYSVRTVAHTRSISGFAKRFRIALKLPLLFKLHHLTAATKMIIYPDLSVGYRRVKMLAVPSRAKTTARPPARRAALTLAPRRPSMRFQSRSVLQPMSELTASRSRARAGFSGLATLRAAGRSLFSFSCWHATGPCQRGGALTSRKRPTRGP